MNDDDQFSFPQVAIQQKVLTQEQLNHARRLQEESVRRGEKPATIDKLVVDCGYMDALTVRAVHLAIDRFRKDSLKESALDIQGYDIVEKIGEGGLGTVYKARQVSMGRMVALKVLHPQWVEDEEFRKRFLLEARIVGQLSHNNLIQVFDVGKWKGRYYFSMEFVDGETVEDILAREGTMEAGRAVEIIIQILRAIQYISRMDLVHRDIKPGNILMDSSANAKLGDFGFVKSRSDLEKELGMEGMVLGTPDYIAPEQAMGDEVDFRSDVYSLGASLYHMVTGFPPFEGSSSAVMEKHIRARVPDPREHRPEIPDSLCHIIEKMMAKKLEDRYQDFADLFEDLDLFKAGLDPASERLAAGKSTIFRAFRIEKDRIEEIKGERRRLEKRVKSLQFRLFVILVALAFSLIATLIMALFIISRL